LRAIRRNNAREAALRHDWLHRIQVVFDVLGLAPTDEMLARGQRLDQIASRFDPRKEISCGRNITA
jgi:hypothetical protein